MFLLGIGAGIALAGALLGAVEETISTHYILLSIDRSFVSPADVVLAAAFGMAAVVAGAWLPAREAARIEPARVLRLGGLSKHVRPRTVLPFLAGSAFLCGAAAAAWRSLAGGPAPLSFAACFFLIVGFALMVPLLSDALAALATKIADASGGALGLLLGLAGRNFRRSLHRTAVTAGALMVAVAMMVGVSVMIGSFRKTVNQWVASAMAADVFVAPAANEIVGLKAFTPVEVRDFIAAHPDVRQVDTYLEIPIELEGGTYALAAVEGGTNDNFAFVGSGDRRSMAEFFEPDRVILSESLAHKLDLAKGDFLKLPSGRGGPVPEFQIAGVYYDYSDDNGRIIISRENFDRHWDEPRFNSLAVYLRDGVAPAPLIAQLRDSFSSGGELKIYTNQGIRERIFEIFDQTFAVTYVLRSIAVLVAVLGIALTLATLVGERGREIGVLRATGAARGQIYVAYLGEASLIGALGSGIGVICGVFLAMLLTWVVNRAFFRVDHPVPHPLARDRLVAPVGDPGRGARRALSGRPRRATRHFRRS